MVSKQYSIPNNSLKASLQYGGFEEAYLKFFSAPLWWNPQSSPEVDLIDQRTVWLNKH